MDIKKNFIYGFVNKINESYNIPRQKLPTVYFQTGDIETIKRSTLLKGSISGNNVLPVFVKKYLDLDHIIDFKNINKYKLNNNHINLINIKYNPKKAFENISNKSNSYIKKSFDKALEIIKLGVSNKLINGPISKKNFLNKKYLGITEYLAKKSKSKKIAMLIYNNNLSVCPITTHLPLKMVPKKITKKIIYEKIILINNFYKNYRGFKPKIAILGLNPHCESISKFNEDEKVLKPTIKNLVKLKYKVSGPYPADTIFLKNNRKKFNVIVGMYHDQVLTPLKTLYEYDAINITLGLPFFRVSPDHGPNEKMVDKNQSDPKSLIKAISFLDRN